MDLSARAVINATGVWAAEVDSSIRLRPSRGTHLVFDAASFGNPTAALTIPIPGETNRFVFALPAQLGRVYLGLTDEESPGPIPDVPEPTPEETGFLLDTANTALQTALTPADVIGAYAGLRPLIDAGSGHTADLSRDHAVLESADGLFSVVGGKLTEYRHMAQDVLDRAITGRGLTAGPCRTTNLPVVGATGQPAGPASLVARFGGESAAVLAAARCDRPTDPVAARIDVTRAEFEFAITHEGALDIDDILDRRTRIGLVAGDRERAVAAAEEMLATR
jgi:glycerol-3-phosphate dehydrogenase